MEHIPGQTLASVIEFTFLNYVSMYGLEYHQEGFNHTLTMPKIKKTQVDIGCKKYKYMACDNEEDTFGEDSLYYETIIESAFLAYFLLMTYNSALQNDDWRSDWT